MERKRRKVSNFSSHTSVPHCTKGMGCITQNNDSSYRFLDIIRCLEKTTFILYGLKYAGVITYHTAKIHRNYHFSSFSDSLFHLVIVHFKASRLSVYQFQGCTDMNHNTRRGSISVCCCDNLVSRTHSKQSQDAFHTCRSRIHANCTTRMAQSRDLPFQLLSPRSSSNPS